MSWLGTGIGAGLGFALGGPIGAAIGGFIGASMGKSKFNSQQKSQIVFFVTVFSMLGKMAKADGVVSKEEIIEIERFMDSLKLDATDRKSAIKIFNNAKDDRFSIYDYAKQYKEIADPRMCEMIYTVLWNVALSDGVIHPEEETILRQLLPYLGLPENYFHEFAGRTQHSASIGIEKYYEILDCSPNDSDDEIKRKYRKAVAEYHPDKIAAKGLPEGFIKFANEQVSKINEAYEKIMENRKN